VSDTSYEGYVEVPREVMQGYALMAEEALQQLDATPTHIFIQGGVGGVAAAVSAHFWERFGPGRPRITVVEPLNAACLFASAAQGSLTPVRGTLETVMAGLACGEPSLLAWQLLDVAADDFMAIPDAPVTACMRMLADPPGEDMPIVAGESGVAGLAALLLAAADSSARRQLQLDRRSRVLVFGTEGDTDSGLYRHIVGVDGETVRSRAAVRAGRTT
jgi:diaminopropionate ammonia-lyase